jgi:hypothetical protein
MSALPNRRGENRQEREVRLAPSVLLCGDSRQAIPSAIDGCGRPIQKYKNHVQAQGGGRPLPWLLHLAPGSPESSRPSLGGPFVSAATTLRVGARRRLDPEVIELFPGPEFCSQPARLFPATGPSLGRPGGISVLRKNPRVWAPRVAHFFKAVSCVLAKLAQFPLKRCLFGRYLARQYRDDQLVKGPKLVHGHRFEIVRVHWFNSDD